MEQGLGAISSLEPKSDKLAGSSGDLVSKKSLSTSPESKIFAKPIPLALLYLFTGTILQWSYGLSSNIVQANLEPLAEVYHATDLEMAWLIAAYMAPNVSLSIILVKLRMQYGLRIFAQLSMVLFFCGTLINSFVFDFESALLIRFLCGIVASPISSLAFLYIIEAFRIEKKFTIALSINLMNVSLAVPIARILSPILLNIYGTEGLYFLEIGMIVICFICIFCLPLTLAPKQKLIEFSDLYSYTLLALGLGLNAVMMCVGHYYGWTDASWIGVCLVIAIICLVSAALIELNRSNPLINLRWVFSKDMLHIAFVLFMFRLLLSEQSTVFSNFFHIFGLDSGQLTVVYGFIALGVLLGGLSCVFFYRPGREDIFHIIALIFLALGTYLDSHLVESGSFYKIYLSQTLIGCGGAMFMPPSMSRGFAKALTSGQKYVISFIAVFLVTQNTGGLMGATFFKSVTQLYQEHFYQKLLPDSAWQNPLLQKEIQKEAETLKAFITDDTLAYIEAQKIIAEKAKKQADIMAYNRVFQWYFSIAMGVLVFIIGKVIYKYIKYKRLKTSRARARRRHAKARRFSLSTYFKNDTSPFYIRKNYRAPHG